MEASEKEKLQAEERRLVRKLRLMDKQDWKKQSTNAEACGLQHRLWLVRSLLAEQPGDALSCAKTAQGWADAHHRARKGDADRVMALFEEAMQGGSVIEGLAGLKSG